MEEHLYSLLNGSVSFPVAWGSLGEGVSTPRAALYRTGGSRDMIMNGKGIMLGTIQIDAYGKTYAEAVIAGRAIRSALEGYKGGPVLGAFLMAIRDLTDEDVGLLHRVSMTFSIRYRE